MDQRTRDALLAADGDDAAFGRLVAACEPDIRRFCLWLGVPWSDLDDVLQETFLRAYRGINTYSGRADAMSWLLTIARRVRLDDVRRCRREERTADLFNAALHVDASVLGSAVEIVDALGSIPHEFREAFVLVKMFGYSYAEVASILGCPRGTVQSRIARARAALAESLGTNGVTRAS